MSGQYKYSAIFSDVNSNEITMRDNAIDSVGYIGGGTYYKANGSRWVIHFEKDRFNGNYPAIRFIFPDATTGKLYIKVRVKR